MDIPIERMSSVIPDGYCDSSCGYCGNKSGNFSYQAYATDLTVEFYQKLLDRGWRRSGMSLYKPDLRNSCCPPYTIRVDSLVYRPSKDQRQKLNRFNKQMIGQRYLKAASRLYPFSREKVKNRKQEFNLTERIHESEIGEQKAFLSHDHSFVVTLEANNFTEEKYRLYENYQHTVHRQSSDSIDRRSFTAFLCDSPLRESLSSSNSSEQQFGTYHQCYRVDGILIAMGVLDLLPQCVSAVYFMYHESVKKFEFGKLSAMREIALAKEKGYRWWYPGFYIHSCIKMRYKAEYSPVSILSPESYQWQIFTKDIKHDFDSKKYLSLTNETSGSPKVTPNRDSNLSLNKDHIKESGIKVPLFSRNMPGILTKKQLPMVTFLGDMLVRLYYTDIRAHNLGDWSTSSIDNIHSIKGIVAEIVSALGTELSRETIIDLQ